jgi:hypothetical protein
MSDERPQFIPIPKLDGNNYLHSYSIKVTHKTLVNKNNFFGLIVNTQNNVFSYETTFKLQQAAIAAGFHEKGIHIKPHPHFENVFVLCVNLTTAKDLVDAMTQALIGVERITQELVKIDTPVFNLAVEVQSFPPVIANRNSAFRPIISNTASNSYVTAATSATVASVVSVVSVPVAVVAPVTPVDSVVSEPVVVVAPVAVVEPISTANTETASASVEPDVQQTTAIKTARSRPVSPLLPTIVEEETVVALDTSAYAPDESDIIGTKLFNMWKEHNEVFEAKKALRDEAYNKLKAFETEYFELETECGVKYTECIRLWEAFQTSKFYN